MAIAVSDGEKAAIVTALRLAIGSAKRLSNRVGVAQAVRDAYLAEAAMLEKLVVKVEGSR